MFASRNVHFAMSAFSIPSKGLYQGCVTTPAAGMQVIWQSTKTGFLKHNINVLKNKIFIYFISYLY